MMFPHRASGKLLFCVDLCVKSARIFSHSHHGKAGSLARGLPVTLLDV
jgi:hypothetical protein